MRPLTLLIACTAAPLLAAQPIAMNLPTQSGLLPGQVIDLPVRSTSTLTGRNIRSFEFHVSLPANSSFQSIVTQAGDVAHSTTGWSLVGNLAGDLHVSGAGASALVGTGTQTWFRIRVLTTSPGAGALSWSGSNILNQGSPTLTLTNGSVSVNAPPVITVGPTDAELVVGESLMCEASGGTAPYTYLATAPAVASMTGALLTAVSEGTTQVQATATGGYSGLNPGLYTVRSFGLQAGQDLGLPNELFEVPLRMDDPAALGFMALELDLVYNGALLDLLSVETAGHLLQGAQVSFIDQNGSARLAFSSGAPLFASAGDTLCVLRFEQDPGFPGNGGSTAVDLVSSLFDQSRTARLTDGSVLIDPLALLQLTPTTATVQAGQQVQFTLNGAAVAPISWSVIPAGVGTVSTNGLFTATNDGSALVLAQDATGAYAVAGPILVHDAVLSVASIGAIDGTEAWCPLVLGPSVNNEPVRAFQIDLTYAPSLLSLVGIEQAGTLSDGFAVTWTDNNGFVRLSAAGTTPFLPGDVLLYLRFNKLPALPPGTPTLIDIVGHLFNEGDPVVVDQDGYIVGSDGTCGTAGCTNPYACNYDPDAVCEDGSCFFVPSGCGVSVSLRAVLEGPYVSSTGLMGDALRSQGLIPTSEPYTALGYPHVLGGGETVAPAVLATTGPNAIVDWVLVELRDATTPAVRVATRAALLQRDGDVVDVDGTSPVLITALAGSYRIALRHRNHLGAMTASSIALGSTPTPVDLSLAATATFGANARKAIIGTFPAQALWAGDVTFNGQLKYAGAANDRDPILTAIGGSVPTTTLNGQYRAEDVNLNGQVRYAGAANDRDIILQNIGGTVPTAVRNAQLP